MRAPDAGAKSKEVTLTLPNHYPPSWFLAAIKPHHRTAALEFKLTFTFSNSCSSRRRLGPQTGAHSD